MLKRRMKTDIGQRLWDYLVDNPKNAEQSAVEIGIARTTLLNIARGGAEPHMKTRCKIENFLKRQAGQLSIEENPKKILNNSCADLVE